LALVVLRLVICLPHQYPVSNDSLADLDHLQRSPRAIIGPLEPEIYMTVPELINYHGYPVQVMEVTTEDGYILTIHRIAHGRNGADTKPRKPVLVQHGLLCSSASWITNTPDKNLPYLLAEEGYDVWLGNIRGTLFGRKHIHLSPKDKQFWAYSFDQMARFDIPAVIDKMLNVTGFEQIYYIGHSMGTTMTFAMLATQPKYNKVIRTMFALAPVAKVEHVRSPLRLLAPVSSQVSFLLHLLGNGEFMANDAFLKFISSTICNSPFKDLCSNILFLLCGYDYAQLNSTRLPIYLAHTPAATSVQTTVHYAQLIQSGNFRKFDYGKTKNKLYYRQETPPSYDLNAVTTKVALFWSDNDWLAAPEDVSWLATKLNNLVLKHRVPFKDFSHLDFIWGIDVKPLLYDKLFSVMKKLWTD